MKSINLGIIFCLCFFSFFPVSAKKITDEQKIFELINKEREERGFDSLSWNSRLADLARSYSEKMARERFFSHFDNEGNSIADRIKTYRIKNWRRIGENLFKCNSCRNYWEIAVRGWMKSPAHRENILEPDFNETGIGVARAKDGTIYVTQVFMKN